MILRQGTFQFQNVFELLDEVFKGALLHIQWILINLLADSKDVGMVIRQGCRKWLQNLLIFKFKPFEILLELVNQNLIFRLFRLLYWRFRHLIRRIFQTWLIFNLRLLLRFIDLFHHSRYTFLFFWLLKIRYFLVSLFYLFVNYFLLNGAFICWLIYYLFRRYYIFTFWYFLFLWEWRNRLWRI